MFVCLFVCLSLSVHFYVFKMPPSSLDTCFITVCLRLVCDDLYQILPQPDYQIFFVISSLVNKIERPSYNIYVGLAFALIRILKANSI